MSAVRPSRYRKKPIVVEAWQFKGVPNGQLELWLGEWFETWLPSQRQLVIRTLESNEFTASAGDWVIKGVQGEFYACKPDVFAATYDPA